MVIDTKRTTSYCHPFHDRNSGFSDVNNSHLVVQVNLKRNYDEIAETATGNKSIRCFVLILILMIRLLLIQKMKSVKEKNEQLIATTNFKYCGQKLVRATKSFQEPTSCYNILKYEKEKRIVFFSSGLRKK
jgi:hypothetical protein